MHRAGVRPDDKVMLVGHSLGGMVAVETARDAERAKGARHFEVTDVVTAGSPIARTVRRLPSTVQVLALENSDDLVPQAEGETNPARRDVTTVTGSSNYHDVGDNHGLRQSYEHIAESVDTSNDPALEYFRADAEDFFDADSVRTERYVVSRAYH
jgi:pimeloyl-ACP methyl ester carboxylesterase